MAEDYTKYLDPKVINKISKLEIKARLIVEGFISGQHKSPYHGFSVEFAEHREYVPGDDIRHVDWKVFGKSDRYYIKQYEEETNFRAHLLLDTSESMSYASGPVSKFDYGCYVAASLAHLIIQQQDSVGLTTFDEKIQKFLPVSSNPAHLKLILSELSSSRPAGKKTRFGPILHELAERITRKGLVMVISDLFDDPQEILLGLQHLRHKKHEVILFHVLDEHEISFPFDDMTKFEGLEGYEPLICQPRSIRQAYLEEVNRFIDEVKKGCRSYNIDYVQLTTDRPLDVALTAYLATRAGSKSRAARKG